MCAKQYDEKHRKLILSNKLIAHKSITSYIRSISTVLVNTLVLKAFAIFDFYWTFIFPIGSFY